MVQSETFPPTSMTGRCLTFWYIARGNQLGRLDVNITTAQNTYLIWSVSDLISFQTWQYASVGFYTDQDYNVNYLFVILKI